MITTEAWVLNREETNGSNGARRAELRLEMFSFPDLTDTDVLIEPLYLSWEGNMGHAIKKKPVDLCRLRKEDKVVIGNGGVARVLKIGASVRSVKEGDICIVTGSRTWDKRGYMIKAHGYDAPNTVGLLAKRTTVLEGQLIPLPRNTKYSLEQWAAFSIRYITAWANWKQAFGCLRVQIGDEDLGNHYVWGWGGGVALAELDLAKRFGCQTAMIASQDDRLKMIAEMGIDPVDRRQFGELWFDQKRYDSEPVYKNAYKEAEDAFLETVGEKTRGAYVSIFIDNIGAPVVRATLKALACPGVIATAGWLHGMDISVIRSLECMRWHTHVNTHYSRYSDSIEAVAFAEEEGWIPEVSGSYDWDSVAYLAQDYASGNVSEYFPLVRINN